MPLDAIPEKDYRNRQSELERLRGLADWKAGDPKGNALLFGARGIGKTELLKQFYRTLFWEEENVIPFYYCFQSSTLKGSRFAADYFGRFLRQFLACVKKDPSFIDNMSVPLKRLMPLASAPPLKFLSGLMEDFREQTEGGDFQGMMLAAVSAPVAAAGKFGKRLVVMLDDFHLASRLYESHPGDAPDMFGLFEASMKAHICPHIITGSPEEALEEIFSNDSMRGRAGRLHIGPLPEDVSFSLFRDLCSRWGASVQEECRALMRHLSGNPLYIGNIARSLSRMQKTDVSVRALRESYAHEVSEGETAFYWSSVFRGSLKEPDIKRLGIEVLARSMESPIEARDMGRLSRLFDAGEDSMRHVLGSLRASGMLRSSSVIEPPEDTVLRDFIKAAHMIEVEGLEPEKVRSSIMEARFIIGESEPLCFDLVIPMVSEAELVAAKAAAQIASRVKIKKELIEQLQLALIEACINAMEHSGSYDKKINLRFCVQPERLEIMIESPGKIFKPEHISEEPTDEKLKEGHKRGWGLTLMRRFMDEVKVERFSDRTRVILVKNISAKEVAQ